MWKANDPKSGIAIEQPTIWKVIQELRKHVLTAPDPQSLRNTEFMITGRAGAVSVRFDNDMRRTFATRIRRENKPNRLRGIFSHNVELKIGDRSISLPLPYVEENGAYISDQIGYRLMNPRVVRWLNDNAVEVKGSLAQQGLAVASSIETVYCAAMIGERIFHYQRDDSRSFSACFCVKEYGISDIIGKVLNAVRISKDEHRQFLNHDLAEFMKLFVRHQPEENADIPTEGMARVVVSVYARQSCYEFIKNCVEYGFRWTIFETDDNVYFGCDTEEDSTLYKTML